MPPIRRKPLTPVRRQGPGAKVRIQRHVRTRKPIPLPLIEQTKNKYGWEKRLHKAGWYFQKNANKFSGTYKPPPKRATPFTKPKELA